MRQLGIFTHGLKGGKQTPASTETSGVRKHESVLAYALHAQNSLILAVRKGEKNPAGFSYLDGADRGGRQRLQVLRVQKVSRPCSQHFQHLYGKSAGLARRVCGRDAVVHGLLADPLPRRAALPRWIGAISQDRHRGRCDHDPILVIVVDEFMCGGVFPSSSSSFFPPKINAKPTPRRIRAVKSEIRQRERDRGGKSRFKSPGQARNVRAGSVRAASPASRSDSVATGPSAQCTTFTRAVGAGDHSASSRRTASELVRPQDRSPPFCCCCRLPVARTRTQIRDSLR